MDAKRLDELSAWRDATLVQRHGDEAAAGRLRKGGRAGENIAAALAITPPTAEELGWTDLNGWPVDPDHTWWGYQGPSSMEIEARRRGKPWPPG